MPQQQQQIADQLAAMDRFEDRAFWRRSKKGNLWRLWDGLNLTVFRRRDGFYGWCIADDDGPRYANQVYKTEADAMIGLGETLGVDL